MPHAIKYFLQGFTNPFNLDTSILPETKNLGEISTKIYHQRLEILKSHDEKANQINQNKEVNINGF